MANVTLETKHRPGPQPESACDNCLVPRGEECKHKQMINVVPHVGLKIFGIHDMKFCVDSVKRIFWMKSTKLALGLHSRLNIQRGFRILHMLVDGIKILVNIKYTKL